MTLSKRQAKPPSVVWTAGCGYWGETKFSCYTPLCGEPDFYCSDPYQDCVELSLSTSLQCSPFSPFIRSGGGGLLDYIRSMNPVGPQPATTTKPIDLVVVDPHSSIHPGPTNPANNVAPTQDAANGGGGGGGGIINPGVVKDEVSNAINHNSAPQNAPNGEPIVITQVPASQPQGIVPVFNNPGGGAHQPGGASGGASSGGVGSDQATVGMNPMIWMSAVGAAFGIVAGVFVIGLFTALRRKRSVAIDTEEGAKDATTAAAAAAPPKIPAVMSWIHRAPSLPAFWHRDDFFDDDSVRTGSGSGRSRTIASTHLSVSVVDQVVVGDDAEKGSEDMIQDVVYTEEMKEQELKRLHAVVQLQRARAENERVIQELNVAADDEK